MGEGSPFRVDWLVKRINRRYVEDAARQGAHGRLLDIGCGRRVYDGILRRHAEPCIGLESDRQRYSDCRPEVWGSGLALPFVDSCFDTVVSFQVLEHVAEPSLMMGEMARILRPGGQLILTAPHMWGIHEEPHDYFRFTGFGLTHLSRGAGLDVDRVEPMAGYWVTAGTRFCYYLQQFEKVAGAWLLLRPLYAAVQLLSMALDRLHRVEGDTWNFLLVAVKPRAESA